MAEVGDVFSVRSEHGNNSAILNTPAEVGARQFELTLRRLAEDLTYGMDASRFTGSGIEYVQSRLFGLGDAVRSIDWRVTARTGKVHVKEYQATKRVPTFVVVDTSVSMSVSSQRVSKYDAAVWIAGVVGLVSLTKRSPVAIVSTGGGGMRAAREFHPSLERGTFWKSLHGLIHADAAEGSDVTGVLERIEGFTNVAACVVVISDLHEKGVVNACRRLAQRHECLVARVVDPAEIDGPGRGFLRASEAETGRLTVATKGTRFFGRDDLVESVHAELVGAGARHEVVRIDEPILEPMRRLLEGAAGLGRMSR